MGGGALAFVNFASGSDPLGSSEVPPVDETGGPTQDGPEESVASTSTQPSAEEEEDALLEGFARDYDGALRREDWQETYSMLDDTSQEAFTEEEWVESQQARIDAEGLPAALDGVTVDQNEEVTDTPARVTLYYEDGTEETIVAGVPMVVEDESDARIPKRFLTEEEISELEELVEDDPEELEAEAKDAAEEYYRAAGLQDWEYTYEHLDLQTQSMFTEGEWAQKKQYYWDLNPTVYHILSVELLSDPEETITEVTVRITGEEGSSFTRTTYWVLEDGEWLHRFSQEEIDSFMPELSYEEFVEANGGSVDETSSSDNAEVEEAITNHYEAIGRGDFEVAYSYFGPTYRDDNDISGWVDEEESYDITDSTVHSVQIDEIFENEATATVDVSFEDNTGSPRFAIEWYLVREDVYGFSTWKLDEQVSAEKIE